MSEVSTNYKYNVSIIMPVYNAASYLQETIDSIKEQTFNGTFEVIFINDGSEDSSMDIIEENLSDLSSLHIDYKIINDGENEGQGARRNQGIKIAEGEAILFLDSDDLLSPLALEFSYKALRDGNPDIVLFEWAYYYPETKEVKFVNKERYSKFDELKGKECEMLISAAAYFTVNKLYSTEFIKQNNIKYGEGYLYEDLQFYVDVAQKAELIKYVPNLLYKVRVHGNSSTKTNSDTMKHYDSFLKAIAATCEIMDFRDKFSRYHIYKYFIYRALLYSQNRIPQKKKIIDSFIEETMKIMNRYQKNVATPNGIIPLYAYAFNKGLVKNLNVKKMKKIYKLHRTNKLNAYHEREKRYSKRKKAVKEWVKGVSLLQPLVIKRRAYIQRKKKELEIAKKEKLRNLPLRPNSVLMLGFDYSYKGNSKYLFEYLKEKYNASDLKFVTESKEVSKEYRIEPRTDSFTKAFYSSEVIIAESWIPLAFEKKEGQRWIQLWHGTPFKKMLFDSLELSLMNLNPNHKLTKRKDISRWDYLIADSEIAKNKFMSSFDVLPNQIPVTGYPRNNWLVKNQNNEKLKQEIREKYGIDDSKQILLYVPTWRDYNYKVKEGLKDFSYILDKEFILELLPDEYVIIDKSHAMENLHQSKSNNFSERIIRANPNQDIQELILISDILISDYSSVVFDGIHVDKPFYLLMKDYEKYSQSRGIYNDIKLDFEENIVTDEVQLVEKIVSGENHIENLNNYKVLEMMDSNEKIFSLIKKEESE